MCKKFKEIWAYLFPNRRKEEPTVYDNIDVPATIMDEDDDESLLLPQDDAEQSVNNEDVDIEKEEVSEPVLLTEISPIEEEKPVHAETPQSISIEEKREESKEEKLVRAEKLISLTIETIRYYDQMRNQLPMDDQRTLIDDVCDNLIDNLIMAGCTPVGEETGVFSLSYHKASPPQMVTEGTPYQRLLRKGIAYNGEVKLLAIVEL